MMQAARLIASCGGIGYIEKGAGTLAAMVWCLLYYFFNVEFYLPVLLAVLLFLFFIGVWSSMKVEKAWGHDSKKIVIDEFLGMGISLAAIPSQLFPVLAGFVLFRFFDIAKPLGVRKMESLPSGWGVMADDLLAGLYTNLVLRVFLQLDWIR